LEKKSLLRFQNRARISTCLRNRNFHINPPNGSMRIAMLDRSRKGQIPPLFAHVFLAEAYLRLDQMDKAKEQVEGVLKIDPQFFLESENACQLLKSESTENIVLLRYGRQGSSEMKSSILMGGS
jgi:hypothetical protein